MVTDVDSTVEEEEPSAKVADDDEHSRYQDTHANYDDNRHKDNTTKDEKLHDDNKVEISDNDKEIQLQTVNTKIVVKKDDVLEYLDMSKRKFLPGPCGANWPRMYNSPCCVVCGYNYIQLVGTQKRHGNYGTLKGQCKICKGQHVFKVKESPFTENIVAGKVQYTATRDMNIDVTVTGRFYVDENDRPDISNPVHDVENAEGLHLKGKERLKIAERAAEIGVKEAYLEQLAGADMAQIRAGNKSSVRSIPVIKMARTEKEKKDSGGMNFYQAVMHVYESQQDDVSPNFRPTNNSKNLPGIIRQVSKMKNQQSTQVASL